MVFRELRFNSLASSYTFIRDVFFMHVKINCDHINFEYAKPLYTSTIDLNFKTDKFIHICRKIKKN
jgi:hypothetical protein